MGIAGAVALASIVVVVGGPVIQRAMLGGGPVEIAMATISDRSPLFEASDIRMRGGAPQPTPGDERFRDVDMPTSVLRTVIGSAGGSPQGDLRRQLEPYLPNVGSDSSRPLSITVDAGLKQRAEADAGRDRFPVRIYDLNDPRAADIRKLVNVAPDKSLAYLLTLKP